MHRTRSRGFFRFCAAVILAAVVGTAAFGAFPAPRPAHAQDQGSGGSGGSITEQLASGAIGCAAAAVISWGLGEVLSLIPSLRVKDKPAEGDMKEVILDCIAWILGNVLIDSITDATVKWINSGFDGNPAYVDNLGGFLRDTADKAAGAFIESADLDYLCSPFKLQIKVALLQRQQNDFRPQCTLSEIVENVDAFLAGDFSQGGWEGWFRVVTEPQNNPYGAYLLTSDALQRTIAETTGTEREKLNFGKGFLSFESQMCTAFDADGKPIATWDDKKASAAEEALKGLEDVVQDIECDEAQTNTPGTVIENQLDQHLSSRLKRLQISDELDEVLSALIQQLILQIFTNEKGLRDYQGGSSSAAPAGDFEDFLDNAGGSGADSTPPQCAYPTGTGEPRATIDSWTVPDQWEADKRVKLSGVNGSYAKAFLSFDFQFNGFYEGSPFQPIALIRNVAAGSGSPGCFLMFLAKPGNKVILNTCYGGKGGWTEKKMSANWEVGHWYRIEGFADATTGKAQVVVKDRDTGAVYVTANGLAPRLTAPSGSGLNLILASGYQPDGVHALTGSVFQNAEARLEVGGPTFVCGEQEPGDGTER